jgi:hypothetical protein
MVCVCVELVLVVELIAVFVSEVVVVVVVVVGEFVVVVVVRDGGWISIVVDAVLVVPFDAVTVIETVNAPEVT